MATDTGKQPSASRVLASHLESTATSPTATASWQDIPFDLGRVSGTTVTEIPCGQAVSAQIRAYATTAAVNVRILARPASGYEWVELVASTAVAIATPSGGIVSGDTELLAATIRYEAIKVQVQQATSGGTATVGLCLK